MRHHTPNMHQPYDVIHLIQLLCARSAHVERPGTCLDVDLGAGRLSGMRSTRPGASACLQCACAERGCDATPYACTLAAQGVYTEAAYRWAVFYAPSHTALA